MQGSAKRSMPAREDSSLLDGLSALEALLLRNASGLGGESRVRAFELLREIDRMLIIRRVAGDLRLELSIAVRAIAPPSRDPAAAKTADIWQGQALEAIRSLRDNLSISQ